MDQQYQQKPQLKIIDRPAGWQSGRVPFFIGQQKAKNAHVGELGVNVHPDYQGMGIGRVLMERLIEWANGNGRVEKIVLQAFATNHNAIKLYQSFGFAEEGRFTKAIKQKNGAYVDIVQMYLFANE